MCPGLLHKVLMRAVYRGRMREGRLRNKEGMKERGNEEESKERNKRGKETALLTSNIPFWLCKISGFMELVLLIVTLIRRPLAFLLSLFSRNEWNKWLKTKL